MSRWIRGWMYLVALHGGLKCADGVDLCDDGTGTCSLHGAGTALADIAIAGNECDLQGVNDVSAGSCKYLEEARERDQDW